MATPTKLQAGMKQQMLGIKKLTAEQVKQIDELLSSLGEFGEIRLIIQRGVLKYVNKVESQKVWKEEELE